VGISIIVQQPGLLTTIQDQGRPHYLRDALSKGGAQDGAALEIANLLVGNSSDAAGLEITGLGPTLFFNQSACIACYGAPVRATIVPQEGHARSELPMARPVFISAGTTVRFSSFIRGFRTWLAFAGGIDSPIILDSRSSHLAAEIGPSRLVANSQIALGDHAQIQIEKLFKVIRSGYKNDTTEALERQGFISPLWSISNHLLTEWPTVEIPVLPGRHLDYLTKAQQNTLLEQVWQVDAKSNRQGLALEGTSLKTSKKPNIMSEPVRFGTVQLPPEGKPFVLMAEHQTTGGYPRVFEVASAARPLLAQLSPESRLRFVLIDPNEAQRLSKLQHDHQTLTRYTIENLISRTL